MKHIKLFEDFVNEKAYRLTGPYAAKGLVGKLMQEFKKEIAGIKYEAVLNGDLQVLREVNAAWEKWAPKEGVKLIMKEVTKAVGSLEPVLFVQATIDRKWNLDIRNGLNTPGSSNLYLSFNGDFVIDVGFRDEFDAQKWAKKLTGYTNTPLKIGTDIYGAFDPQVGYNNVEIREGEVIMIDNK